MLCQHIPVQFGAYVFVDPKKPMADAPGSATVRFIELLYLRAVRTKVRLRGQTRLPDAKRQRNHRGGKEAARRAPVKQLCRRGGLASPPRPRAIRPGSVPMFTTPSAG